MLAAPSLGGSGADCGAREEGVEAVEALVQPLGHAARDHGIASFDRLVGRMHPGDRPTVALFEAESLDRDVAGRALVLECLDEGIGRWGAVEDAVEPMLVAVGRAMDVAPSAPVPDVVLVDYHLEAARPEPLLE